MKPYILGLSLLALLAATGFGGKKQATTKLYAYAQPVHGGVKPDIQPVEGSDEQVTVEARPKMNYFIYLEHKRSKDIRPLYVFLDGKAYYVSVEEVQTPVELESQNKLTNEKIVLVPKTKNKVLRLTLTGVATGAGIPEREPGKAVTVKYRCRKATNYITAEKFTILEPAAMM